MCVGLYDKTSFIVLCVVIVMKTGEIESWQLVKYTRVTLFLIKYVSSIIFSQKCSELGLSRDKSRFINT